MSESTQFPISLFPTGDDGAFRLRNKPGEMQRVHVLQDGTELMVQADLFSIAHGKCSPNGDPATLIVIDFRFTGCESNRKRFRTATIKVMFALNNQDVGNDLDPEVLKIAPHGTYFMNPSTQNEETKLSANTFISGGGGPISLGIGLGWKQTKSVVKEQRTILSGIPWIEERDDGSYNSARWKLHENILTENGIPSFFRTAMIVVPRSAKKFRAFITVETDVNLVYSAQQRIKKFRGGRVVDPVYFDDEEKRKPYGPTLAGVDLENLAECDLEKLSTVQTGISI